MSELIRPFCCEILENCIFKNSKPAIVGVEVLLGEMKVSCELINENKERVGQIKQIKDKQENLKKAKKNMQVAISVNKLVVGKNGDVGSKLYCYMSENNFKKLKENKENLSEDEISCLKQLAKIMRVENQFWGK
jgi:translation initiation factor 5B